MSKDFLLLLFVSDLWSIAFLKTARVLSSCSFAASFQEIIISITLLCAYQGGNKCSVLRTFDVLCFLETPVLRFGLLPYYQQLSNKKSYVWPLNALTAYFKKDVYLWRFYQSYRYGIIFLTEMLTPKEKPTRLCKKSQISDEF